MDKRGSCGVLIIFIRMYGSNGQTKDSLVDIENIILVLDKAY